MIATQSLKIFIIDDDLAINLLLKTMLSSKGHHVLGFPEPKACPCAVLKESISRCPQESPCVDVVISDIMMPGMTGIEFLKIQEECGCKVLNENKALISSIRSRVYSDEIKDLGCQFFAKPFKLANIVQWVEESA